MALKPTYIKCTLSYTCKYFIILSTCKYFIIWNKILFYFLPGFTWLEVTLEHSTAVSHHHFTGCSLTFGPVQNIYTPLHWINPGSQITSQLLEREISQSQLSTALLNFSHWNAGKQFRANGRDSCSEIKYKPILHSNRRCH